MLMCSCFVVGGCKGVGFVDRKSPAPVSAGTIAIHQNENWASRQQGHLAALDNRGRRRRLAGVRPPLDFEIKPSELFEFE